jgi:DNA repair ATPase RecN
MSLELIELKNRINKLETLCSKYNSFGLEIAAMLTYVNQRMGEIEAYDGADKHIRDLMAETRAEMTKHFTKANNYLYVPDRMK